MSQTTITLPPHRTDGQLSLEQTLLRRRSVRRFKDDSLPLGDISQILWAAQGVTDARGLRTAPSAGALYPLDIYMIAGRVAGLSAGIYQYHMRQGIVDMITAGDLRAELCRAALRQNAVAAAAVTIAVCATAERMTVKYGERGIRYVQMEAGHAAQNICLQAVALDLAAVVIGAFYDRQVHRLLQLAPNQTPLYLIPVGKPR